MMKTYQSYKPSGVEWIGEIPEHWEIKKNRFFTISKKIKSEFGKEELLSVSEVKGVIPRKEIRDEEQVLSRSESLEGYLVVEKGDLVSNIMLMWKRGLGVSDYNGIVSPSYSVFSFVNSYPKYFHYLFRTEQYISEFRRNSRGVIESRLRLYDDIFGSIFSHSPPLQEQLQIVKFLDDKTSIIDKLISTKERKIEFLKEQRSSLINEVITKGLDPNVKMKDSGVEWIGEIPYHWERTKLKRYVSIFTGYSFKSEWFGDVGIPVVRISNIQDGYIDLTKSVYLTENYLTKFPDYQLEKNDSLICLTGSLTGKVGKFNHKIGLLNQRVGKIKVKGDILRKEFIDEIFFFSVFQQIIKKMGEGISENFPNVSHLDVVELEIPLPPIKEQEEIIDFLERKKKEIDDLVQLEQKKIELLKEYRQSLISEVITGKIKVVE